MHHVAGMTERSPKRARKSGGDGKSDDEVERLYYCLIGQLLLYKWQVVILELLCQWMQRSGRGAAPAPSAGGAAKDAAGTAVSSVATPPGPPFAPPVSPPHLFPDDPQADDDTDVEETQRR